MKKTASTIESGQPGEVTLQFAQKAGFTFFKPSGMAKEAIPDTLAYTSPGFLGSLPSAIGLLKKYGWEEPTRFTERSIRFPNGYQYNVRFSEAELAALPTLK